LVQDCRREQLGVVPRGDKHGVFFDVTSAERQLLREVAHLGRSSQGAVLRKGILLAAEQVVKGERV
jgi:hypothetical protein